MTANKDLNKEFSGSLKGLINQLNMTQADFAESIGITPGGLSDILRGKTKKPSGTLIKLIELKYGVDLENTKKEIKREEKEKQNPLGEVMGIYKKLTPARRKMFVSFVKTLENEQELSKEEKNFDKPHSA